MGRTRDGRPGSKIDSFSSNVPRRRPGYVGSYDGLALTARGRGAVWDADLEFGLALSLCMLAMAVGQISWDVSRLRSEEMLDSTLATRASHVLFTAERNPLAARNMNKIKGTLAACISPAQTGHPDIYL